MIMKRLTAMLLVLLSLQLYAQDKQEREFGVKEDEVPETALKWFNEAFNEPGKVNWYYEISSGKDSYEAKFKWKGNRYSVEFDTTGVIEDVEVTIPWKKIPSETRKILEHYFRTNYTKYKILKVQKQYSGEPGNLKSYMQGEEPIDIITVWEIEFHGRTETENELWEGLFAGGGSLLQIRKIIQSPTNNLEF
jgi:hypothetical protein